MANQIAKLNGSNGNGAHSPMVIGAPGLHGSSGPAPGGDEGGGGGGAGLARFVHALRRRWLVCLMTGLLLCPLAMLVGWFCFPAVYTASATIQLKQTETPFIFDTMDASSRGGGGGGPFETFKRSQQSVVKHSLVLGRAVNPKFHPDVASLPILKEADDHVEWLQSALSVSFPADSEYMRISLSAPNPNGLKTILMSVIEEYFDEAVGDEQRKRLKRLGKLDAALQKESEALRRNRQVLKVLEEKLGNLGESQGITRDLANYISKLTAQKLLIRTEEASLKDLQDSAPREEESLHSEDELSDLMRRDPVTQRLEALRQAAAKLAKDNEARADLKVSGAGAKRIQADLEKSRDELQKHEIAISSRKLELAEILNKAKRDELRDEIRDRQQNIRKLKIEEEQLGQEVSRLRGEASAAGVKNASVEVIVLQGEIEVQSKMVADLQAEANKTRIELDHFDRTGATEKESEPGKEKLPEGPRIRFVGLEEARPAPMSSRLMKIAGIGGVVFVLPFFVIVFFEAQKYRISTRDEITQAVGLSVIGAVPILPQRVMQRLNGPAERDKYWRSLLSESVDSIAAVLLRGDSGAGGGRIVMVSSANAGEGKTTLAAHLAVSLAGAGRHVILADFDLRRPALHRVFGVSLEPGAFDTLRGGKDLESSLQATQVPNLMLLPAGRWNKSGLSGLAAADLQSLFDRLRGSFDFVIVDASPILPVVDTRLIGQHVDAVLLSVLRDVSRAPKLRAACELLDLFGIPVLGVVVTGPREEIYKDARYEAVSETQPA